MNDDMQSRIDSLTGMSDEWRRLANENLRISSVMADFFRAIDETGIQVDETNIPRIDTEAYEWNPANAVGDDILSGHDHRDATLYGIPLAQILEDMYGKSHPGVEAMEMSAEDVAALAEKVKKVKPVSVQ